MNKLKRLGAAFMCLSMSLSICPCYTSAVQITDTNIVDGIVEDDVNVSTVSSVEDDTTPDDNLNNDNLSPGGGAKWIPKIQNQRIRQKRMLRTI